MRVTQCLAGAKFKKRSTLPDYKLNVVNSIFSAFSVHFLRHCAPLSLPPLLIELSWTDEQGGLAEAEEEEVVSPPPAAAAVDRNILVGNGLSV